MAETRHGPEPSSRKYGGSYWFVEVWEEVRPLAIKLCADFATFTTIWALVLAAHGLTVWLPLETTPSRLIVAFHEVVASATFMWLSVAATWEIMWWKRRKGARHGSRSHRRRS